MEDAQEYRYAGEGYLADLQELGERWVGKITRGGLSQAFRRAKRTMFIAEALEIQERARDPESALSKDHLKISGRGFPMMADIAYITYQSREAFNDDEEDMNPTYQIASFISSEGFIDLDMQVRTLGKQNTVAAASMWTYTGLAGAGTRTRRLRFHGKGCQDANTWLSLWKWVLDHAIYRASSASQGSRQRTSHQAESRLDQGFWT